LQLIETRSYEAKDGGKTSGMNTGAASHNDSSIPTDYFGGGDMTPIDDGEDMPF